MPQLDPTWFASQIFWLVLAFVALYFVLARKVLPQIQAVIARREQTVSGDLNKAQELKSQAEHARQDYERTLADARGRAQQLMSDAMAEQKAKAEQSLKDMDREIEKKLADASKRIATKKKELISALTPTTAELASIIVEKLTKRNPTNEQVDNVISTLFKQRTG